MGYYMRFIVTDPRGVTESEIADGLRALGSAMTLNEDGDLETDDSVCGQIDLNRPGDGLFEDELAEFKEAIEDQPEGDNKARVRECLKHATAIVAVQVLSPIEESVEALEPLWTWLFDNREGLMQADAEGFYDREGLILPEE